MPNPVTHLIWILLGFGVHLTGVVWAEDHVGDGFTNSIGMQLQLIPAGEFQMGTLDWQADRAAHPPEMPQHLVQITKAFYLGKYEVTRGAFRRFCDATHYKTDAERVGRKSFGYTGHAETPFEARAEFSWRNPGFKQTDEHPVVVVSWNDAEAFCRWLSEKERMRYHLPTEAEWEWSCRSKTASRWSSGNDLNSLEGVGNIEDKALTATNRYFVGFRVNWNDGYPFTAPIGKFRPNKFGLYDMHGNVQEWCSDWFDTNFYLSSPLKDPKGPANGKFKVVRGGDWGGGYPACRSSARFWSDPSAAWCTTGFRVKISKEEKVGK